jgi:hypothetical protein
MALTKEQWEKLPPDVQSRYPKPSSNFGLKIFAVAVSVVVLGFLIMAFPRFVNLEVDSKLTSFKIVDENQVITEFEVKRDLNTEITCALRAQDDRRVDVGYAWLTIKPSNVESELINYPLATRSLAVLVEVLGCSVGDSVAAVPAPQVEPGTQLPDQPAPGRKPPGY